MGGRVGRQGVVRTHRVIAKRNSSPRNMQIRNTAGIFLHHPSGFVRVMFRGSLKWYSTFLGVYVLVASAHVGELGSLHRTVVDGVIVRVDINNWRFPKVFLSTVLGSSIHLQKFFSDHSAEVVEDFEFWNYLQSITKEVILPTLIDKFHFALILGDFFPRAGPGPNFQQANKPLPSILR